ncbi:MAG: hypothetical protein A3G33_10785 [Omnitrophica bacterium RIFCSPLOWO2_12_FULL_44_17]|uniref:Glycosyltransferase 2-like domain-containing protein n=1 Tax=Candidatus Danuiimicrobium aquiferis TaxID=1801832 RepID=A0A1G1KR80_9BACT|nr:MAG: hypothetical protein A3B72_03105 [Omnitrophica bacterium RIFCSPHIGHO2_02_FULL_45_28]OGW95454.1 MAG: hypothetical protein A3G33_10785 [Omnitrophica bacterium RIFCSPLOWO2_12_FULL_44_17]OGX03334.1 MAG: hypothetical protein A3J12_07420 [Omnitrophica bacterium RIFCSPLOWO2_02_FULL_44_11]
MANFLISVILPTYNREKLLREAIESVKKQTFADWELIVVDDGSTDATRDILKDYCAKDLRIKMLRGNHGGAAAARNLGMRAASGKYIAFLDDDDLWLPEKLLLQYGVFEKYPDVGFVFTDGMIVNEDGRQERKLLPYQHKAFCEWLTNCKTVEPFLYVGQLHEVLIAGNCIATPTLVLKRETVETVGGFNANYEIGEDYDFWIRLSRHFSGALLKVELVTIRITASGLSGAEGERDYRWREAEIPILEAHLLAVSHEQRKSLMNRIKQHGRLAGGYYLKQRDRKRSRKLLMKSLQYQFYQPKILLYLFVSYLPLFVISFLHKLLWFIRRHRHENQ